MRKILYFIYGKLADKWFCIWYSYEHTLCICPESEVELRGKLETKAYKAQVKWAKYQGKEHRYFN